VRAFGKQDLEGAAKAWQKVIDIAPVSGGGHGAPGAAGPAVGASRGSSRRAAPQPGK
jgi:hypothetical protein